VKLLCKISDRRNLLRHMVTWKLYHVWTCEYYEELSVPTHLTTASDRQYFLAGAGMLTLGASVPFAMDDDDDQWLIRRKEVPGPLAV
jgi:hypothetical protein